MLYFQKMNEILAKETLHKKLFKKMWMNQIDLVWLLIVPLLDTNKNLFHLFILHNIGFYSSFQNNSCSLKILVDFQLLISYTKKFALYKSFLVMETFLLYNKL